MSNTKKVLSSIPPPVLSLQVLPLFVWVLSGYSRFPQSKNMQLVRLGQLVILRVGCEKDYFLLLSLESTL